MEGWQATLADADVTIRGHRLLRGTQIKSPVMTGRVSRRATPPSQLDSRGLLLIAAITGQNEVAVSP